MFFMGNLQLVVVLFVSCFVFQSMPHCSSNLRMIYMYVQSGHRFDRHGIMDSRIRGKFSTCASIYMFIRSLGWSGWFIILIVWRNGQMLHRDA